MAVTNKEILEYTQALEAQGLSPAEVEAELYRAAKQYDVNLSQVEEALGMQSGTASKYISDKGLDRDWTVELASRGTEEAQTEAFQRAIDAGYNMSDAIAIMNEATGGGGLAGNLAYGIDAFGRDRNLGWLDVGEALYGKTGDDFNYPYNDRMLDDLYGGMFSDAAAGDMKFYADRYGMGSDDIASYLTAHTGTPFTPEMIQDYLFNNDMGQLYGTPESYTPTPGMIPGTSMADYSAYDKRPDEGLTDYYNRLRAGRSGGILGTRDIAQGMFNAATPGSEAYTAQAVSDVMGDFLPKSSGATSGSGDGSSSVTPIDWSKADPMAAYERWQNGADWKEQLIAYMMPMGIGELGKYVNDLGSESAAMDWLSDMGAEDLGGWEAFADAWDSWGSDGSGSSDSGYSGWTGQTPGGYTGERGTNVPPPK